MREQICENKISIRSLKSIEYPSLKAIYSRNEFFKARVAVEIHEDYMIFKHEYIDDIGKTYKPFLSNRKANGYVINIRETMPVGIFSIQLDESNEDELVVYFNK